ncbi:nuclear transport factor 2 family protein [Streptomyces sp. MS1.HAVA.3]|uniref:Nuclear transport factor 2 family protein n=1 Tax=Streptomyces caledonius TaxID=3134107 RepID=A0ABU8UE42_9ACTN
MTEDEEQIRTLIEQWAAAVHRGDLNGVLADHSDDIVMFDVPPPYEGVRGIDAYRETWPPFFEWQARGASFEIVSLDVTAGDDVAYAHALLRCGTHSTVGYAAAVDLVDHYPHAALAVVDDAGHALPHEQPALLRGLLAEWLVRVERSR